MVTHGQITNDTATMILQFSEQAAERRLLVVDMALYAPFEEQACLRIRRDPDDWPTVAVALAAGIGIWTNDQDFCGCGLPVWSTETLLAVLG